MLFFPDRISLWLVFIPVIAAVQYVFTLGLLVPGRGRQRLLPRPGNVAGHVLRLWWFLSPACTAWPASTTSGSSRSIPS